MDVFDLYRAVFDEERKFFNVAHEKIESSLAMLKRAYSCRALKKGKTYIDFNLPQHRCAYLYRFGPCHTQLVDTFCRVFLSNAREAINILKGKDALKICCIGGGPGTDLVGLLKALISFKRLRKKVSDITILDICGGWRNSFKIIIKKLKERCPVEVSDAFQDQENLMTNLIAVDLMGTLSEDVVRVIEGADIICMVKFVSAVISKPTAELAFKELARHMKTDAIVIFIDNLQSRVYKPVETYFHQSGLQRAFRYARQDFRVEGNYPLNFNIFPHVSTPLLAISACVYGWIKRSCPLSPIVNKKIFPAVPEEDSSICNTNKEEDGDSELDDYASDSSYSHNNPAEEYDDDFGIDKSSSDVDTKHTYSDQCTQTLEYLHESSLSSCDPRFEHLENQLSVLQSRLSYVELLIKGIVASETHKCCRAIAQNCKDSTLCSCTSDDSILSTLASNDDQHGVDHHYFRDGNVLVDSYASSADVMQTPFLVLPTEKMAYENLFCVPFIL